MPSWDSHLQCEYSFMKPYWFYLCVWCDCGTEGPGKDEQVVLSHTSAITHLLTSLFLTPETGLSLEYFKSLLRGNHAHSTPLDTQMKIA